MIYVARENCTRSRTLRVWHEATVGRAVRNNQLITSVTDVRTRVVSDSCFAQRGVETVLHQLQAEFQWAQIQQS